MSMATVVAIGRIRMQTENLRELRGLAILARGSQIVRLSGLNPAQAVESVFPLRLQYGRLPNFGYG